MSKPKNITFNNLSKEWATLDRIDYDYQFKDGIERVLNGMNTRTKGKSQMNLAVNCVGAKLG